MNMKDIRHVLKEACTNDDLIIKEKNRHGHEMEYPIKVLVVGVENGILDGVTRAYVELRKMVREYLEMEEEGEKTPDVPCETCNNSDDCSLPVPRDYCENHSKL